MNPNQKKTNQTKKPLVTGQTAFVCSCIGATLPLTGFIGGVAVLLGLFMGIIALKTDQIGRRKAKWAIKISISVAILWLLFNYVIAVLIAWSDSR